MESRSKSIPNSEFAESSNCRKMIKEKPFKCQEGLCTESFLTESALHLHYKLKHPKRGQVEALLAEFSSVLKQPILSSYGQNNQTAPKNPSKSGNNRTQSKERRSQSMFEKNLLSSSSTTKTSSVPLKDRLSQLFPGSPKRKTVEEMNKTSEEKPSKRTKGSNTLSFAQALGNGSRDRVKTDPELRSDTRVSILEASLVKTSSGLCSCEHCGCNPSGVSNHVSVQSSSFPSASSSPPSQNVQVESPSVSHFLPSPNLETSRLEKELDYELSEVRYRGKIFQKGDELLRSLKLQVDLQKRSLVCRIDGFSDDDSSIIVKFSDCIFFRFFPACIFSQSERKNCECSNEDTLGNHVNSNSQENVKLNTCRCFHSSFQKKETNSPGVRAKLSKKETLIVDILFSAETGRENRQNAHVFDVEQKLKLNCSGDGSETCASLPSNGPCQPDDSKHNSNKSDLALYLVFSPTDFSALQPLYYLFKNDPFLSGISSFSSDLFLTSPSTSPSGGSLSILPHSECPTCQIHPSQTGGTSPKIPAVSSRSLPNMSPPISPTSPSPPQQTSHKFILPKTPISNSDRALVYPILPVTHQPLSPGPQKNKVWKDKDLNKKMQQKNLLCGQDLTHDQIDLVASLSTSFSEWVSREYETTHEESQRINNLNSSNKTDDAFSQLDSSSPNEFDSPSPPNSDVGCHSSLCPSSPPHSLNLSPVFSLPFCEDSLPQTEDYQWLDSGMLMDTETSFPLFESDTVSSLSPLSPHQFGSDDPFSISSTFDQPFC